MTTKKLTLFLLGIALLFSPQLTSAAWYDDDWDYRVQIAADATKVPSNQTDVPLYVDLSLMPADFFTNVKSDGGDIVVTADDEVTVLQHELVEINTAAQTGELHVKVPALDSVIDTDVFIYYGNVAASDSSTPNVWSDYRAVWHLNEPSVQASDQKLGVATQAAMDGGDGSWALFHGNDAVGNSLNLSVDEDQIGDAERDHTNEQLGYWLFGTNSTFNIEDATNTIIGEVGLISDLDTNPTVINLQNSYTTPVVITTPNLITNAEPPAVVRISGTTATTFTAYMQNPGDIDVPADTDVYYIVMEAGDYTLPGGTLMEAGIQAVNGENASGNWGNGEMEEITPVNAYTNPVVLGQVMTTNDPLWSTFWTSNGSQTTPPQPGAIYVGKQVGQDGVIARASEDVGYVIIQESNGFTNGVEWVAELGVDTIEGTGEAGAPYSYNGIFGGGGGASIKDSTINSFDVDPAVGVTAEIAGKIGKAVDLSGSGSRMNITGLTYSNNNDLDELTASFWLNTTDTARSGILDFDRSEQWQVGLNFHNVGGDAGKISFDTDAAIDGIKDFNSSSTVNSGLWRHVTVVYDRNDPNDKKIYIDGLLDASTDQHSLGLGDGTLRYGIIGDGSEANVEGGNVNNLPYEGSLDEIRIQNNALSADRILTVYNNESNNGAFWTVSAEQQNNTAPAPPTTLFIDHTNAQASSTNPVDLTVGGTDNRILYFSAIYNDDDAGDIADEARIQVSTDPTFGVISHWDSGFASIANVTQGNRSADIEYDNFGNAAVDTLAMEDGAVVYYWRIAFKDDGGEEGEFASPGMFMLMDLPNAPGGVSTMKVNGSPDTFQVQWQDTSTNEASFEVEVSEGGGAYSAVTGSPTVADVVVLHDTDTSNNSSYEYQVRACNYAGCSTYNADPNTHYTEPDPPDDVFGDYVSDNEFTVHYTDRAVLGMIDIERCIGLTDCNALSYTNIANDVPSVQNVPDTFTDNDAMVVDDKIFRWRARGTDGLITHSQFTVAPYEYTSPGTPLNVEATYVTDNLIEVEWTDNSTHEDGFRVWVSENGGPYTEITPGVNTVGAGSDFSIFSTAQPNKDYAFRVVAHIGATVNNAELFSGNGDSPVVKSTPALPTDVTATYNADNDIDINWTDNAASEDNYRVYVSENGGAEVLVATLAADSITYNFNAGVGDRQYEFSVESVVNQNLPNNPVELTNRSALTSPELYTTPATPGALIVNGISNASIEWDITDNATYELGFIIYESDGITEVVRLNASDVDAWTETGLNPNEEYIRTIAAFLENPANVELISGQPVTTSTYTLASAPDNLVADSISDTLITLTWDDGGNPVGTEFNVFNNTLAQSSGWTTDLTWDFMVPDCDITYEFEIRARNVNLVETIGGVVEFLHACEVQEQPNNGGGGGGGTPPVCGNDKVEFIEQCDDGNKQNGDGCSATCKLEILEEESDLEEESLFTCEHPFDDIMGHEQEEFIQHLYCEDVISGKSTFLFEPDEFSTRAEFLKMAMGINGYNETAMDAIIDTAFLFADTSDNDWHSPYIALARELDFVEGYDNNEFRPNQGITEAEALKVLLLTSGHEVDHTDQDDPWYVNYEAYASSEGMLGEFVPTHVLMRGEAAEIISTTLSSGDVTWLTTSFVDLP